MKILRYTEDIQKHFGLKTKPEPWMHIIVKTNIEDDEQMSGTIMYAIYVWDTRKVIESNEIRIPHHTTINFLKSCKPAVDNKKPLLGLRGDVGMVLAAKLKQSKLRKH